jgi:hypothetical protein
MVARLHIQNKTMKYLEIALSGVGGELGGERVRQSNQCTT